MDFFQAQDTARKRSKLLVFYYIVAVALIIAAVYAAVIGAWTGIAAQAEGQFVDWWQPDVLAGTAAGTIAVIGLGSLFKILSLRGGGGVVARSVGGVRVDPGTTDPKLHQLHNVVEEMALASGVRVPEVYLLPEDGINAFAAGYSPDDAAVAVTRGCLETLSRDELQGVIAHEFSHILNGDMRLNIRLIGLLFGILLLAIIGRTVFYSMRFSRMSSGRGGKGSGGAMIAMVAVALTLLVVGYVGVLFGRLIQAAVSRQREYLADASAVQFTRNPAGIAGALKKIGGLQFGSQVKHVHAAETSHMFFANAMSGTAFNLFATHPPLVQRIRAIEPSFDGKFRAVKPGKAARKTAIQTATKRSAPPPLRPDQFVATVAAASILASQHASSPLAAIPATVQEAAHDPLRARAIVIGILLADSADSVNEEIKGAVDGELDETERDALLDLEAALADMPKPIRLSVVDLALPAIRTTGQTKIDGLTRAMRLVIAADEKTTLFEFALSRVVTRYLHPPAWKTNSAAHAIQSYRAFVDEIAGVLSAIARAGANEPVVIQQAFSAGASQLGPIRDQLSLRDAAALKPDTLINALERLEKAALPIKKNLIDAMSRSAAADGTIHEAEAELLRVVAAAIDCPAPPRATR